MKKIIVLSLIVILIGTAAIAMAYVGGIEPLTQKGNIFAVQENEATPNTNSPTQPLPEEITVQDKSRLFYYNMSSTTIGQSNPLPTVELPQTKAFKRLLPEPIIMPPIVQTSLINLISGVISSPINWTVAPISEPIVVPLPPIIWSGTGQITYVDLDGGFYGIVANDGKQYDPTNLPQNFKNDGLHVNLKMKVFNDQVSIHMWGAMVEILEINAVT